MMTGTDLIVQERARQICDEGYTLEHDADHDDESLLEAAEVYLLYGGSSTRPGDRDPQAKLMWPWDDGAPKISPDPIRNLVKAGALIAAEIDRLLGNA